MLRLHWFYSIEDEEVQLVKSKGQNKGTLEGGLSTGPGEGVGDWSAVWPDLGLGD